MCLCGDHKPTHHPPALLGPSGLSLGTGLQSDGVCSVSLPWVSDPGLWGLCWTQDAQWLSSQAPFSCPAVPCWRRARSLRNASLCPRICHQHARSFIRRVRIPQGLFLGSLSLGMMVVNLRLARELLVSNPKYKQKIVEFNANYNRRHHRPVRPF